MRHEAKAPVDRIIRPFEEFAKLESSGGIVLFMCTLLALIWANSMWSTSYFSIWETYLKVGVGDFLLSKPLLLWINDGLMAIFFFVVGLEIKREVLIGELASPRRAALPIAAALGGMAAPALIYFSLNAGAATEKGWAIPMATDIAFALGALSLLGKRVPVSLKIFLAALAIVDDIGAILVIAIFYSHGLSVGVLGLGIVLLALMALANKMGVRNPNVYVFLGIIMWVAFLKSGVHATVAGVLAAMTIPSRTLISPNAFVRKVERSLKRFKTVSARDEPELSSEAQQETVHHIEKACENLEAPMMRLEHGLLFVVSFFIMPIFALANAGVVVGANSFGSLSGGLALGTILGLVIGKPIGIVFCSWLAVKLRLADLGSNVNWRHVVGVGFLGGIGFTMSLFIGNLGFGGSEALSTAKLAILIGSSISGLIGFSLLYSAGRSKEAAT